MSGRAALVAILAAPLVLAVGAAGSPAKAQSVFCGETVTQSVKLTADLHCSSSDGLDIGGNHVTIDLGGHTIYGASPYNGVADTGYPYATIKNGSITGFAGAVFLDTAPHAMVTGIVARQNPSVAIGVTDSAFTAVSKVTVVAYGYEGVYLQTDGSSLTSSSVAAASNPVGIGVVVWGSGDTVSRTTVSSSAKAGILVQYGGGNQVTKNRVQGAGDTGIRLYDTQGATLSANSVTGSASVGILVRTTSDGTTALQEHRRRKRGRRDRDLQRQPRQPDHGQRRQRQPEQRDRRREQRPEQQARQEHRRPKRPRRDHRRRRGDRSGRQPRQRQRPDRLQHRRLSVHVTRERRGR